jgi:transcriptional regulator with XRE-family HTH domain
LGRNAGKVNHGKPSLHSRFCLTPNQCRAARALIDMTQPQLAEAANLGLSTVVDYEKSRRSVSSAAVDAIRSALEAAGVEFIPENGSGAGVRLKKSIIM